MNNLVSAFVFVLVSMMLLVGYTEAGWFTNCCTKSLHIKHDAINGGGVYTSEICKDGHRLPNLAGRENESCGKTVRCNLLGCECDQGCRTNDKDNCDEEALRLFMENDGKRLGITGAQIQYPKGTTPQPCGKQNP